MKAGTLDHRFSFERAALVLRNSVLEAAPGFGVGLAIVVGVNLFNFIFSRRFFFNDGDGRLWTVTIVLAGVLLASQAFKGMHDGKSGTDWLLLPATALEKYSAAVFECIILFPVAAAAVGTGLSALFSVLEAAARGRAGPIWAPFGYGALAVWGKYAVAAIIVMAGSASFRKLPLLKTLALVIAYGLTISGILGLGGWLVARGHGFDASSFNFMNGSFSMHGGNLSEHAVRVLTWIYRAAWYGIMPLFGLVYGCLRVFEKEARDEVQ